MTLCAALLMTSMSMQAQKTMTPPAGGKAISDHLIGIFFEDISSSADGGLYAELLQNGSFEYNPPNATDGEPARHGACCALATRSDAWNHAWTPHSTPTIPPTCGCILSA